MSLLSVRFCRHPLLSAYCCQSAFTHTFVCLVHRFQLLRRRVEKYRLASKLGVCFHDICVPILVVPQFRAGITLHCSQDKPGVLGMAKTRATTTEQAAIPCVRMAGRPEISCSSWSRRLKVGSVQGLVPFGAVDDTPITMNPSRFECALRVIVFFAPCSPQSCGRYGVTTGAGAH